VFSVVVEKSDATLSALQLSVPVTTVAPLQRQMSPGSSVVNLSQRISHTTSLTGGVVSQSALVSGVLSGTSLSVAGSGRPTSSTVTTTHATVLHTIRPVVTQAITVCTERHIICLLLSTCVLNTVTFCSGISAGFRHPGTYPKKPGYTHLKKPTTKNPHFYFNLILVCTLYATNNAIFYCF